MLNMLNGEWVISAKEEKVGKNRRSNHKNYRSAENALPPLALFLQAMWSMYVLLHRTNDFSAGPRKEVGSSHETGGKKLLH